MRSDIAYDPMIPVLAAFESIPEQDRDALFADFAQAASARDLRRLLDAISDWAATAELYANESLRKDFAHAQAGRKDVADWVSGR